MNVGLPGAKLEPSPINQAVVPFTGVPAASTHWKAAPPHSWTSIPRWVLYQERSLVGSLALKKTPPMPVTRFILDLLNNHAFPMPYDLRLALVSVTRAVLGA